MGLLLGGKHGTCTNVCLNFLVHSLQEMSPSSTEGQWAPEQPQGQVKGSMLQELQGQQDQGQDQQGIQGQPDSVMQEGQPGEEQQINWDAVPHTPPTPLGPAPTTPSTAVAAQGQGQEEHQEQQGQQAMSFQRLNSAWTRFKSGQTWWEATQQEGGEMEQEGSVGEAGSVADYQSVMSMEVDGQVEGEQADRVLQAREIQASFLDRFRRS